MPTIPKPPPLPSMPVKTTASTLTNSANLPLWAKETLHTFEAEIANLITANELKDPKLMCFYSIQPILQDGPQ